MPSIFVHEFVSGGGMWALGDEPGGSLLAEGTAMRDAFVEDFRTAGFDVSCTNDVRLPSPRQGVQTTTVQSASEEMRVLAQVSAGVDWTLVIAPEFAGLLAERCQLVAKDSNLLGDSKWVSLFSNKHQTARWCHDHNIPAPMGEVVRAGDAPAMSHSCPAIVKPVDGAGSMSIELWRPGSSSWQPRNTAVRVEEFFAGQPVSATLLLGAERHFVFPPMRQILSENGRFEYVGGDAPLPAPLHARAVTLAENVSRQLPTPSRGWMGIDMVLGENVDVVIEINPRPTTSYIGLRQMTDDNLALASIAAAAGCEPALKFKPNELVSFRV